LPPDFADQCLEQAAQLTPADLQQAAQALLTRPSLSLCGPAEALQAGERVWNRHPLSR
jgi:predicted Zn-dependent peptidase